MTPIVGNLGSLSFHALDHIGYMKIYLRLSKSIEVENKIFKSPY